MSTNAPISRKSRDAKHMNHTQRRLRRMQIARDVRDNRLSVEQAARKYGVSIDLVYRSIRESELFDPRQRISSQLAREQIFDRLQEGASMDEIVRETGFSETTVANIMKEFGMTFPRNSARDRTLAIVAALFDRDKSVPKIAQEFRVSKQYVYQVLQRAMAAGIPLPPRGQRTVGDPFASVSLSTVDL